MRKKLPRLKDIATGLLTDGFYDVDHYKQFHRYIFRDIYPWAGEFRTINIFKNEEALNGYSLEFIDHESIESHLTWTSSRMNKPIIWLALFPKFGEHMYLEKGILEQP